MHGQPHRKACIAVKMCVWISQSVPYNIATVSRHDYACMHCPHQDQFSHRIPPLIIVQFCCVEVAIGGGPGSRDTNYGGRDHKPKAKGN